MFNFILASAVLFLLGFQTSKMMESNKPKKIVKTAAIMAVWLLVTLLWWSPAYTKAEYPYLLKASAAIIGGGLGAAVFSLIILCISVIVATIKKNRDRMQSVEKMKDDPNSWG